MVWSCVAHPACSDCFFSCPRAAALAEDSPQTVAQPPYDVRNFGALGDGKTDDTAAFQKALDAAAQAGGGIVRAPLAATTSSRAT